MPDINDFTLGLKAALKPEGTITLEFPHLLQLIKHTQFDTVYHEHFSYLSLYTVNRIFVAAGLRIWNVEQLTTHGGSLRVYGCHANALHKTQPAVSDILTAESNQGLQGIETFTNFQAKADKVKNDLLFFLLEQKRLGKKIAAYGAAAKGNTILNYAGIKTDLIAFVCDAAIAKQYKFMPGSHIPILPPAALRNFHLDCVVVLPWNIAQEIRTQNAELVERGIEFYIAVPELTQV